MQRRLINASNRKERSRGGANTKLEHQRVQSSSNLRSCLILTPLLSVLFLWLYATIYIISSSDTGASISLRGIRNRPKHMNRLIDVIRRRHTNTSIQQINEAAQQNKTVLISRNANVTVTSSARGNLGPPSVLNQATPGIDWLKDRWQAASDMHGSAIPGTHWVILDFSAMLNTNDGEAVYVTKIELDWETAFASDYRIETRMDAPTNPGGEKDDWCVLYDAGKEEQSSFIRNEMQKTFKIGRQDGNVQPNQYPHVSYDEYGRSPGVKEKLPLHIIHTLDWTDDSESKNSYEVCHSMRYLRLFIRKSARGWGVSLWQIDVYGYATTKS